jgi:hypothetical protein
MAKKAAVMSMAHKLAVVMSKAQKQRSQEVDPGRPVALQNSADQDSMLARLTTDITAKLQQQITATLTSRESRKMKKKQSKHQSSSIDSSSDSDNGSSSSPKKKKHKRKGSTSIMAKMIAQRELEAAERRLVVAHDQVERAERRSELKQETTERRVAAERIFEKALWNHNFH